jgi:hypothetical protein
MDYLSSFALYTLTFSVGLFSYSYYSFMGYRVKGQKRIEKKLDKYICLTGEILEKIVENQKMELLQDIEFEAKSNKALKIIVSPFISPNEFSKTSCSDKKEPLLTEIKSEVKSENKLEVKPEEKINSNKKTFDFNTSKTNLLSSMALSADILNKRLNKIERV